MPAKIHSIHSDDKNDGGFNSWVLSIPIITRYWFVATLFFTLIVNFGYIHVQDIIWNWDKITNNFEVWRFVTPFVYAGGFRFNMLVTLYNLVVFSRLHELSPYNTGAGAGTADYVFALLFGLTTIMLSYPFIGSWVGPCFTRNLIFFVVYTWSKRHTESKVNMMFLGDIPALVFPFAYVLLELLCGHAYMDLIHGIVVGHVYYFVADVVPMVYGEDLLHTPQFLIRMFGFGGYKESSAKYGRCTTNESAKKKQVGHHWGKGQRLG